MLGLVSSEFLFLHPGDLKSLLSRLALVSDRFLGVSRLSFLPSVFLSSHPVSSKIICKPVQIQT